MASIGFIGCGKLGIACAEMVAEVHDVVGYDIAPREPENFRMVPTLAEAVQGQDIVFIAVETPHNPQYDGKAPTSHLPNKDFDYTVVKNVLREVNAVATKDQLVVLISTVLPGTVRNQLKPLLTNARFVYNPYLIAMGTVKWDMVNPEMVMIGTEDGSETGDAKQLVYFYRTIMQNKPRYIIGTWDETECIKVFYNTFISAKVSLVNMIQDVAERLGNVNAEVVCDALATSDRRIMGPGYMKPGMGDGGACVLPEFNITVNGEKIAISDFYNQFDQSQAYLVRSAKYSLSSADEKKVHTVTCREYSGEILVFETDSGKVLECTPEHLLPIQRDGNRMLVKASEVSESDKFYIV